MSNNIQSIHKMIKKILLSAFALSIVLVINFPTLTVIINSFKLPSEFFSSTALFPHKFSLGNYVRILIQTSFPKYLLNSFMIAIAVVVIIVIVSSMSGYILSRWRQSRILNFYSYLLLSLQMIPLTLVLIPLFFTLNFLNLINTYASVIFLYTTGHLAFSTWLFRGFVDKIPASLEEAAYMEGYRRWQVFLHIIFPLLRPGMVTVGIFAFLTSWNEFFIASIFLGVENKLTMPVGISLFIQYAGADWAGIMTASSITLIPSILFFLMIQRHLIGSMAGAVKG